MQVERMISDDDGLLSDMHAITLDVREGDAEEPY